MPIIHIGDQSFEVADNTRLILAIEDAGIPILHRCGGYAKCTTCRVKFESGEPAQMTEAEKARLQSEMGLYRKIRLACQINCEGEMHLQALMTMDNSQVSDPGRRPEDSITPPPIWTERGY
jgi:ferredoxin